jgi:hypothetical protein
MPVNGIAEEKEILKMKKVIIIMLSVIALITMTFAAYTPRMEYNYQVSYIDVAGTNVYVEFTNNGVFSRGVIFSLSNSDPVGKSYLAALLAAQANSSKVDVSYDSGATAANDQYNKPCYPCIAISCHN